MTKDSLLARAISFLHSIAFNKGNNAAEPLMAMTTLSIFFSATIASRPALSVKILTFLPKLLALSLRTPAAWPTQTKRGRNSLAWRSKRALLELPLRAMTRNLPGNFLITSRVLIPIEPVEPNIAMFTIILKYFIR